MAATNSKKVFAIRPAAGGNFYNIFIGDLVQCTIANNVRASTKEPQTAFVRAE
ncbi:MAG: hypothetical protein H7175_16225 [Burkholderiales bacterium]|nr:hypothetical protein [Anaerolineae bacterium]